MFPNRNLFIFFILLTFLPTFSYASSQPYYVNGRNVNMRLMPSPESPVLQTLSKGDEVLLLDTKDHWMKISIPGSDKIGYIHQSLLTPADILLVSGQGVALRKGPGKQYSVLDALTLNTPVALLKKEEPWAHVQVLNKSITGWIHLSLLQQKIEKKAEQPTFWQGNRIMADGTRYIGQFKNGLFHGKGELLFPDGRKYTGEFFNGTISGYGVMKLPVGSYTGDWKDGKFHGTGTLIRFDGSKYIGRWENNQWMGEGKYISATGDVYEGQWKDGKFHGTGIMTYADGRVQSGRWERGKFVEKK